MWKKLRRIATTFIALAAGYAAYLQGFAVVAGLVAVPARVPLLPEKLELSASGKQARELARLAFGPGHWTADAVLQYYDTYRGFWIFARDYSFPDEDQGKKLVLKPFALIWRSGRSKALKTLTGEEATLVFNQAPDMARGGGGQTHVTWAQIRDNVQLRDDKGTPAELGDDLTIGPMSYLVFSEEKNTISSESPVVIREGDTIATSDAGVEIALLPRITPEGIASQTYEGARTITLLGHILIHTQDVGESGLVPGGAEKPAEDGKPREPRPGEITCDNGLRIDLPPPRRTPRVGPPPPMGPTYAHFSKNVQVRQGNAQAPEQLNSDQLHLTLLPADKSARSVDAKVGGPVASLSLHKAHGTGHAVWLQSKEQHLVAGPGTELVYQRRAPAGPDTTYFRGLRGTEIRKENIDEEDPARSTLDIINTYDVTIYHQGRSAAVASAIAGGPGWMESRSLATHEVLRRAEWSQRLVLQPVEGDDRRRQITLDGRPRVLDPTQGEITASQQIVALLVARDMPKAEAQPADPKAKAPAPAADPKAVAQAQPDDGAKKPDGPLGGGSYRIEMVRASRDVVLVTHEAPAEGAAKEGPGGGSKKTIRARQDLIAHFEPPPEPPAGQAAPAAPAESKTTRDGQALALADQPKAPAGSPEPQGERPAPAEPKPSEPPIEVNADRIWARLAQATAEAKGSEIREVRLRGDVLVHQDPEPDKEKGLDVEGDQVDLVHAGYGEIPQAGDATAAQGEPGKARPKPLYQVRTLGNLRKLARISTPDFELWGFSPFLDQSRNFARVDGPGKLIQYKAGGSILGEAMSGGMVPNLGSQEKAAEGAVAKADEKKPEKERGPLTISWGLDVEGNPLGPFEGQPVESWMEFHGVTTGRNGEPGPAQALFFSNARYGVLAKTDDSEVGCYRMIAFLDAPVDFRRAIARPRAEGRGDGDKKLQARVTRIVCEKDVLAVNAERDPRGRLTDLRRVQAQAIDYEKSTDVFTCEQDVEIVAIQYLEGGQVKEKQRVVGQEVIYKKATGDFFVNSEGDVDLYARAKPAEGEGQVAEGGRTTFRPAADGPARRGAAQAKAKAKANGRETLMPLELTQIHFNRSMNGQVAARREGSKRANGEAEFFGGVEMIKGVAASENERFDPLKPSKMPRGYVRSFSRTLRVISEPPPTKGEADHILVRAFGELYASSAKPTGQVTAITADDQMVYDSAKGLSIIYGGPGGVRIVDQSGLGQKGSYGGGSIVVFNHKTGQHTVKDARTVQFLDPRGGFRADSPPVEKEKPREKKKRPMFPKVNQSDKERKNFTGR